MPCRGNPTRKPFALKYLFICASVLISTLEEPIVRPVLEDLNIALMAFEPEEEVIVKWTSSTNIVK